MENQNYQKEIDYQVDLMDKSVQSKQSFFHQILLVSSGILGILISLYSNNSPSLYVRLVFALSLGLLTLGILALSIVLYDYSELALRLKEAHALELESASQEGRKTHQVFVSYKKRTIIFEKCSLIFLLLGLIFLTVYGILVLFIV